MMLFSVLIRTLIRVPFSAMRSFLVIVPIGRFRFQSMVVQTLSCELQQMFDTIPAKVFFAHVQHPHFADTLLLHQYNRPERMELLHLECNLLLIVFFFIMLDIFTILFLGRILRVWRVCCGSPAAAPDAHKLPSEDL